MIKRINHLWRLFATAMAFSLFGLGGALVPVLAVPMLYLFWRERSARQRAARRLVRHLFKGFIHFMRSVGILTWQVDGVERLRQSNAMILANHPTLLDVVFLVAFVPNADCIVKGKLDRNPAMRGFIRLTGYITNKDGVELVDKSAAALAKGGHLIIFPEGTRTPESGEFRFQRGAANILLRTMAVPVPVVIKCSPPTLSKEKKWYHIPPRKFHMSFKVLPPFDTSEYKMDKTTIAARRLTSRLEQLFCEEMTTS